MKNYNREVRPVINASTPVVVHVGITLTQIFDMVRGAATICQKTIRQTIGPKLISKVRVIHLVQIIIKRFF